MKTEARDEARNMRLEGASIREIKQRLGVARSSVSRWVSGIELAPKQLAELERRSGAGALAGAAVNAERARERRREWQEEGRRRARAGNASYISGCMLYWGVASRLIRQPLLQGFEEEKEELASIRDGQAVGPQHADPADDLRVDPRDRRLQPARVARLTA
jgi:post-segregation antitoxin (ccd killing protein)